MKLWFRQGESLNLDSLVPVEVLATKDMLEYGTSGISEQLYGLQIEMTRLSIPMELSELEQMARSRYWIRVVGRFIGIGNLIIGVVCVQLQT